MEVIKYFSTFTGIGGFELGIGDKAKCVGYSEIDKYAIQIYESHFNHKNYGDITKIAAQSLPDFDFICGGFPCQSFSIAGKRGGFNDTRGTLFFDIARIIKFKRPRLLLLENVKGLLSHDGGRTFDTIIRTLDELGYDLQWQVCNSKNFGVPQNRERVFIVGHLRGTPRPQVFPIGKTNEILRNSRIKEGKEVANTLRAKIGGPDVDDIYIEVPEATKKGFAEALEGDSINLSVPNSKTRRGRVGKGIAQTLDTGGEQAVVHNKKARMLTITERERLQGFPDGWTEGISETQRKKCIGNAVTVNVIREITKRLL